MDDYVLYISAREFPPDAQSSITGKRKTARICHVEHEEEDSYQVLYESYRIEILDSDWLIYDSFE
jgi:hypothetical protein